MDPITFWRNYTGAGSSSISAGDFELLYGEYDQNQGFGILSVLRNTTKSYVSTTDFTSGSYSVFTPPISTSGLGDFKMASQTGYFFQRIFRKQEELIAGPALGDTKIYANNSGTVINRRSSFYFDSGIGKVIWPISLSTDGGVTWDETVNAELTTQHTYPSEIFWHEGWGRWVMYYSIHPDWSNAAGLQVSTSSSPLDWTSYLQPIGGATGIPRGGRMIILRDRVMVMTVSGSYGAYDHDYFVYDKPGNSGGGFVYSANEIMSASSYALTSAFDVTDPTGPQLFSNSRTIFRIDNDNYSNPTPITQQDLTGGTTIYSSGVLSVVYNSTSNQFIALLANGGNWGDPMIWFYSSDAISWTKAENAGHGAYSYRQIPVYDPVLDAVIYGDNGNRFVYTDVSDMSNLNTKTLDSILLSYAWQTMGPVYRDHTEDRVWHAPTTVTTISEPVDLWYYTQVGSNSLIDDVWISRNPLSGVVSDWKNITGTLSSAIQSAFGSYVPLDRSVCLFENNYVIWAAVQVHNEAAVVMKSEDEGDTWSVVYNGYRNIKRMRDTTLTEASRWYQTRNVTFSQSVSASVPATFDTEWAMWCNTYTTDVESGLVQPGLSVHTVSVQVNGVWEGSWGGQYEVLEMPQITSYTTDSTDPNSGLSGFVTDMTITPGLIKGVVPGDVIRVQGWLNWPSSNPTRIYGSFLIDDSMHYLVQVNVTSSGEGYSSDQVTIDVVKESGTPMGSVQFKAVTSDYRMPKNFAGPANSTTGNIYLYAPPMTITPGHPLTTSSLNYNDAIVYSYDDNVFRFEALYLGGGNYMLTTDGSDTPLEENIATDADPRWIITGIHGAGPESQWVGVYAGGSQTTMAQLTYQGLDSSGNIIEKTHIASLGYAVGSASTLNLISNTQRNGPVTLSTSMPNLLNWNFRTASTRQGLSQNGAVLEMDTKRAVLSTDATYSYAFVMPTTKTDGQKTQLVAESEVRFYVATKDSMWSGVGRLMLGPQEVWVEDEI
jgi:hypothetical protein